MNYRNIFLVKNEYIVSKWDFSLSRVSLVPVLFILLIFSPMLSRAQKQPGVKVGDRVRIDVPSMKRRPMVGYLAEINADGLMLHGTDSTYFIHHSSVRKLSVSTGKRRNIGKGAIIGMLGGAALGGIVGLISYEECTEEGFLGCLFAPKNQGQAFTWGAVLGIVPGSLIGIAIGSSKTDRWEKVPTGMLLDMKPVGTLQPTLKPQVTLRWSIRSGRK